MELNTINKQVSWGVAADALNKNFEKVGTDLEKLKNVTTRNKGYFSSEAALNETFPTANVGDIAYVKVEGYDPFERWSWNGTQWVGSGIAGGNDNVELGNYYTISETDEKFTETDETLSELGLETIMSQGKGDVALNPLYGFELINGQFITQDGGIGTSAAFSYTKPFKVSEGDVLVFWRQGKGCAGIASVDADGAVKKIIMQNVNVSDTEPALTKYIVQKDVEYLSLCSMTSALESYPPFIAQGYVEDRVVNLESQTKTLKEIDNFLLNPRYGFELINGQYITQDGGIATSKAFSYTKPFKVSEGDVLVFWRLGLGCAGIASVDADGNILKVLSQNTSNTSSEYTPVMTKYVVKSGIEYISLCSMTSVFESYPPFIAQGYVEEIELLKQCATTLETEVGLLNDANDFLLNPLYGFELINGQYITQDGGIGTSEAFSYTKPFKVSEGDVLVAWMQGNGCMGIASVDADGVYRRSIRTNTAENTSNDTPIMITYKVDFGVEYISLCSMTSAFEKHPPFIVRGFIDSIAKKDSNTYIHDAAAIKANDDNDFIKIFSVDTARKYFSISNLKKMIEWCGEYGVGYVQLHFSDNLGFRFVLDDSTFTYNGKTYDLLTIAGDCGNSDGTNKWHTQSDMDEIISFAKEHNVSIIPLFDMPGHMRAVMKLLYGSSTEASTLDITRSSNVALARTIAEKYVKYFATMGCKYYNFACDEADISNQNQNVYAYFVNEMCNLIAHYDMIPFAWNDAICSVDKFPYMNKGLNVLYWNETLEGTAMPQRLKSYGYKLLRSGGEQTFYYVIRPEGYTDEYEQQFVLNLSNVKLDKNMYRGVLFCLWCDYPWVHGADEGDTVTPKMEKFIKALGENTFEYS